MKLTDSQLNFYVNDVLALRQKHKQKYQPQIDYLIQTLSKAINQNTTLGVIKVVQAGSWPKGTALRPRDGIDLDIDLVVYIKIDEASKADLAKLHTSLIGLLQNAYPQKSAEDFTPSVKTVGITYRVSGLKVDLVPVVPLQSPADYVWQPEIGGGGAFRTSPPGQLKFIRGLKASDARFATVVRLLKRWRHLAELDHPSSFVLELVAAHVTITQGAPPSIEEGLLRVLVYIAQSGLKERISFTGAIGSLPARESLVRIYDPTNNENNGAAWIDEAARKEIVAAAERGAEALNLAAIRREKGDTLAAWKSVLGTPFRIEEAT